MPWIMEVKTGPDKWEAVRPTGGKRYEYATYNDAYYMLEVCYPDQLREERLGVEQTVRVREAPPLEDVPICESDPAEWRRCRCPKHEG